MFFISLHPETVTKTDMKRHALVLTAVLTILCVNATPHALLNAKKIEAERLPDMNIPRSGHTVLLVNGEVTVFGGHTTNFVPTATAEYWKDGEWHLVQTAFTHDNGFALALSSGKVLLAGGHEKNMGIGQSYEVELYDPVAHTSQGLASLDRKRCLASATEIDSGRVVIAGNWYEKDGIGLFDGQHTFSHVKDVTVNRSTPFILRIAKDDVIIVGNYGSKGDTLRTSMADHLQGEAYNVPLLEEWQFFLQNTFVPMDASFIGDEQNDDYTYLLPVKDKQGQMAIARVTNGEFSLLPTDYAIPMKSEGDGIYWCTPVIADRQNQLAYLIGINDDYLDYQDRPYHLYVLTINYAAEPARLSLGYAGPLEDVDGWNTVLTPDGNLMIAGGLPHANNFQPSAAAWLLHVSPHPSTTEARINYWLWGIIALALLALAVIFLIWKSHRNRRDGSPDANSQPNHGPVITADDALMCGISELMESQRLYLNSDLKLSDVATALGTNRNYISDCINKQRGCSFTQYVNTYRIEYAKTLLRSQPDMKMSEVYTASGFASENTFFRTFKALTGMTPAEFKA